MDSISEEIRNCTESRVFLLDAPPGTGKSYTLTYLIERLDINYELIVYSNNLVRDFHERGLREAKTILTVFDICNRLLADEDTILETFYKIYVAADSIDLEDVRLLVLDEYIR